MHGSATRVPWGHVLLGAVGWAEAGAADVDKALLLEAGDRGKAGGDLGQGCGGEGEVHGLLGAWLRCCMGCAAHGGKPECGAWAEYLREGMHAALTCGVDGQGQQLGDGVRLRLLAIPDRGADRLEHLLIAQLAAAQALVVERSARRGVNYGRERELAVRALEGCEEGRTTIATDVRRRRRRDSDRCVHHIWVVAAIGSILCSPKAGSPVARWSREKKTNARPAKSRDIFATVCERDAVHAFMV